MVGQMIASYSFTANATVMKADDRMTKTLLDITA
jgi:flagellar basal-body rod protein FlgC